jgi:hypothetical protein
MDKCIQSHSFIYLFTTCLYEYRKPMKIFEQMSHAYNEMITGTEDLHAFIVKFSPSETSRT